MKRWGLVMAFLWWWVTPMSTAFCDDPIAPAVLNDPTEAVSVVKTVISKLSPSYETVWNFRDGTFSQGVSASLYGIGSNNVHLASVRLGFGTNENLYAGLGLDLPGLCRRFVPQTIKGFATVKPLDISWSVVGNYARVMPIGGYSWGDDAPVYGVSFGAA